MIVSHVTTIFDLNIEACLPTQDKVVSELTSAATGNPTPISRVIAAAKLFQSLKPNRDGATQAMDEAESNLKLYLSRIGIGEHVADVVAGRFHTHASKIIERKFGKGKS